MRIFRLLFYLVFFLFNFSIFGSASYLFGKYPNLLSDFRYIHYISGLGIVLFFIAFGIEMIRYRKLKRIITKLEDENIEVKAKLSELENPRHQAEVLTEASDRTTS